MLKINWTTKYLLLLGMLSITTFLWIFTKLSIEQVNLLDKPFGNLAQLLGLLAINFFTVNFILATRFYFIEKLFGGLDKMYKFHKFVARIAFTLAWAHPILLILENFMGTATIQRYFLFGSNTRWNAGMAALYLMTLLVLFSVTKFLPYHIWKNSHRFMVFVMGFLFIHVLTAPGSVDANIFLKLWIIGLIIVAILCWLYIELLYKRIGPVFYYKVTSNNKIGAINELILEPQNRPMTYKAGQFTFLSFLNNKNISRELHPFTISSNPHEYHIRISAKDSGDYTSELFNAKPGDLVKLIGPYGYFTRDRLLNSRKQIWIAGGIGITPFLSMLAAESAEPSGNKINLFYTVKSEQEAVYKDELIKNSDQITDLELTLNFDSTEGYLTAKRIAENLDYNIKEASILLCGPTQMMHSLRKQFMDMGLDSEQIIFEDFALKPV